VVAKVQAWLRKDSSVEGYLQAAVAEYIAQVGSSPQTATSCSVESCVGNAISAAVLAEML